MTSVKAVAAIAVVVLVVCAAVGAYIALNDNGPDSPTRSGAIGNSVSIGDMYTLEASSSDSTAPTVTTYEVVDIQDDTVLVDVTTDGTTERTSDSVTGFLDDVSTSTPTGMYQRSETISTDMGQVVCDIYFSEVSAGNATTVSTYDWIGQGTNIIYKTEITIRSNASSETYTTVLKSTNMIDTSTSVDVPSTPSIDTSTVRDEIVRGDYIEYTEYNERGWREDVERFTVLEVRDGWVFYTDDDDWEWDDSERISQEGFRNLLIYSGTDSPVRTETIETEFGNVSCNVYQPKYYPGFDWDEQITFYVGASDDVIYMFTITEWDDWRDEVETYKLTGTSLFLDAPSSGGGSTPTPSPSENRYGVELAVGDYYTIHDDDDRYAETRTIIAIENGRLIVEEREGNKVEMERMSANDFLDDIMVTQTQIDRMTSEGSETLNGVQCQKYSYRDDDDRVTIWVDSRNVIWKTLDDEGWFGETETLEALGITSLI